ncbi:MAG TPA: arginine--tRNA ligase [Alphaproteobacteria bacterium]|nr:arginine--tRNA ligase [Alphaproteobacteria bacterium]HJM51574.1 arginine--tRNA ligase [Alphaproteobacteria bacterium]
MNVFNELSSIVHDTLEQMIEAGELPPGLDLGAPTVTPPRDPAHGDVATNAALALARPAGRKPRDIAEPLARRLTRHDEVASAEVAGPGFINLRLAPAFWQGHLAALLAAGPAYGDSQLGGGESVNVEYVSANPTGPLHVGHARGAVFGDALAALLEKAGFRVTREYYINDAGAQVEALARSLHLRYRQALGQEIGDFPAGLYPGEYLIEVGRALAERDGERWLTAPESEWLEPLRDFAGAAMMDMVQDDLAALGISQDVFSSERALVEGGKVDSTLAQLEARDLIYQGVLDPPKGKKPDDWEPRPQTLFRATSFGDDVDRPLAKSDGSWTYFATDMAYHRDKVERGFASLIDVWGADHGGYVKRMKAAVSALSQGRVELDVKLCQMVKLSRGGEPVKMSKRTGSFVTLRDVVDEVGRDVVRFIMLTRRNDAPLEFDFTAVTEQSRDNPVFYVQYAHARACSVLRQAPAAFAQPLPQAKLSFLTHEDELALIKLLAGWPQLVESAAAAHEPHRVAFFLHDVAAAFHQLWNRGKGENDLRFIIAEDAALTVARLALVRGVAAVIASGLAIMGVTPVEEMR